MEALGLDYAQAEEEAAHARREGGHEDDAVGKHVLEAVAAEGVGQRLGVVDIVRCLGVEGDAEALERGDVVAVGRVRLLHVGC
jgi:hypothetical protein